MILELLCSVRSRGKPRTSTECQDSGGVPLSCLFDLGTGKPQNPRFSYSSSTEARPQTAFRTLILTALRSEGRFPKRQCCCKARLIEYKNSSRTYARHC